MKYYICYQKGFFPSAKLLRDSLVGLTGEKIYLTRNPRLAQINWGRSDTQADSINSGEFVRQVSNKLYFQRVVEGTEVWTPWLSRTAIPDVYPIIRRELVNSSGGRGIHYVAGREEDNWPGAYWTHYIPTVFELRVHVLGGEIVRVFKKIPNDPNCVIRNNNSCHFSLVDPKKYQKLYNAISSLSEIFGKNNFYAADVAWSKEEKKYIVWELNSAPGLNENTALEYAMFIAKTLGLEIKNDLYRPEENH